MPDSTKPFWNERYADSEYAYGTDPNKFVAKILASLSPGRILLPCDGEGRNAVYAAGQGWDVLALDQSVSGREKALKLAASKNVTINFIVADCLSYDYPTGAFDAVVLCYAHFPATQRQLLHQACVHALKPGGTLILEAFSKDQIGNPSGGPRSAPILYDIEELKDDYRDLKHVTATSVDTELDEGLYHVGPASVVRFVGRKPE